MPHTTEEGVQQPYPPAKVSRLMVNAYFFSRGDPVDQSITTEFLVSRFGDKFIGADLEQAQQLTLAAATDKIASKWHPKKSKDKFGKWVNLLEAAPEEVGEAYKYLVSMLTRRGLARPTSSETFSAFLNPDLKWLPDYELASAHNPHINHRDSSYSPPPYTSNVIKYILLGQTLQDEEFNAMFHHAGRVLFDTDERDRKAVGYIFGDFPEVAAAHLAAHEEDRHDFMAKIIEVEGWERLFEPGSPLAA